MLFLFNFIIFLPFSYKYFFLSTLSLSPSLVVFRLVPNIVCNYIFFWTYNVRSNAMQAHTQQMEDKNDQQPAIIQPL